MSNQNQVPTTDGIGKSGVITYIGPDAMKVPYDYSTIPTPPSVYLISSLRNREATQNIALGLRKAGWDVFDDWLAPGPRADDEWKEYEELRGRSYEEALKGYAAQHVYEFDKYHLDRCDTSLLVMPAGKSAFLELGYTVGRGKPTFLLIDEPDRWDVMMQFVDEIAFNAEDLLEKMNRHVGGTNG